eukprot:1933452-Pyramimonas_sp.AAC.1
MTCLAPAPISPDHSLVHTCAASPSRVDHCSDQVYSRLGAWACIRSLGARRATFLIWKRQNSWRYRARPAYTCTRVGNGDF